MGGHRAALAVWFTLQDQGSIVSLPKKFHFPKRDAKRGETGKQAELTVGGFMIERSWVLPPRRSLPVSPRFSVSLVLETMEPCKIRVKGVTSVF